MKKWRFFLLFCGLFFAAALYAQEGYEPEENAIENDPETDFYENYFDENDLEDYPEEAAPQRPAPTPEQRRLELEIRTSSLAELAAWSRSLGLSEAGTRGDLTRRLREHFNLGFTTEPLDVGRRIITIESARVTEYFTIEVVNEEYARLYGDVSVSLIEGENRHRISAREILFNRTRNIITASGGVEYVREGGGTVETFRGENITINIDDWTGVFLDGVSERALAGDGVTYSFEGRVITRGNEDVTILDRATIRNISNPEALWSITASRVWLLPGSDFAILNAFLRIGEIPVLYIPFFYFPADQIVFHPVLGFRTREGAYVQTTTYIFGRPTRDGAAESSLTRLMGDDPNAELVREGLFLRNTGRRIQDPQALSLKLLVDYYANLGAFFGLELATPRIGPLNNLDISIGFGLTRTIWNQGNFYSPFGPDFDGSVDRNRSNLLGLDVPFRYRFRVASSISGRHGSLTWTIPFFSDPFVDIDFMNRSEVMDWIGMVQGAALTPLELARQEIQHYQWNLSGNLRLPTFAPLLTTLSFSGSSVLSFNRVQMPSMHPDFNPHSPSRFFFAPVTHSIYSVSGNIGGTLLTLDSGRQPAAGPAEEAENPLRGIGIPRSPWAIAEIQDDEDIPAPGPFTPSLSPPALAQRFDLPRAGNLRFSIAYDLRPESSSMLQFRNREWETQEDMDWGVQSILSTFGGTGRINFSFNHSENFFTNTMVFETRGQWRQFSFINEEADYFTDIFGDPDPARIAEARGREFRHSFYIATYMYTGVLRPLHRNAVWGNSELRYRLGGNIAGSNFIGTGDAPEWEHIFGAWNREQINTHDFTTTLNVNIRDRVQQFSFSSILPPLEPVISANATVRAWITETAASIRVDNPADPVSRIIRPLTLSETIRFAERVSLVHRMTFAPEPERESYFSSMSTTSVSTTLTLWDFNATFSAIRLPEVEFALGTGWTNLPGDPTLRPHQLTLNYSRNFAHRELIRDRLNFSLNFSTNVNFDLHRYTNSNALFNMGFNLNVNNFLYLQIRSVSRNQVIMRYFRNLPGMEFLRDIYIIDDRRNNVFLDLMDSFNFFNEERRRSSGFKMSGFTLNATHRLGDWNAVLLVDMAPRPGAPGVAGVRTDVSFFVQWVPISEFRVNIRRTDATDGWEVNH